MRYLAVGQALLIRKNKSQFLHDLDQIESSIKSTLNFKKSSCKSLCFEELNPNLTPMLTKVNFSFENLHFSERYVVIMVLKQDKSGVSPIFLKKLSNFS